MSRDQLYNLINRLLANEYGGLTADTPGKGIWDE
jgi:hypothetical protein